MLSQIVGHSNRLLHTQLQFNRQALAAEAALIAFIQHNWQTVVMKGKIVIEFASRTRFEKTCGRAW